MNNDKNRIVYELLLKVFRDNAYASIELNNALKECNAEDKPYITRLFYGVLERSVYYDYVLSSFAAEKPKKPIAVIVKMGYYMLENMRAPEYAAVNNMVSLCKSVGKSGAAGFVNSALRNFSAPELPEEGTCERLSVECGYPLWLVNVLVKDYGYSFVREMTRYKADKRTHIRPNYSAVKQKKFEEKYAKYFESGALARSPLGYYASREFLDNADKGDYVIQSLASMAAVHAYLYGAEKPEKILDLCAAPGGKSALIAHLSGGRVTSCDIHAHRLELLRKYAFHCDVMLDIVRNDAAVLRPEWKNAYDLVVCDVPCSGIGVVGSKPDILYNRSYADIAELVKIQKSILDTAKEYVKEGGRLCYSTCSILKAENTEIINGFLAKNKDFERIKIKSPLIGEEADEICLFPHIHGCDGFYVAALGRRS